MPSFLLEGQFVDVHKKKIFPAEMTVKDGKILSIKEKESTAQTHYILPGFIDSHVHIESSMLIPSEFARLAVVHGTVATVSDPHEIANVCGMEGVEFMIRNGKKVPFKFHFGAPSCVPATVFETAGAKLDSKDVEALLKSDDIFYLSEMMNFPGVLNEDEEVMKKIAAAHKILKPVDGHAPGLRGDAAKKYIAAGITTDHECFTKEEALDKLQNGMKILIREGSAAKNFEALIDLLNEFPNQMMFCSDDKHPDSLEAGHINQLCARAIAKKIPLFHVLQAACVNPVLHYKMKLGLLKENDPADFIVVKDLENFGVLQTYIDGKLVAENGKTKIDPVKEIAINFFNEAEVTENDLAIPFAGQEKIPVIEALDGQLITNKLMLAPKIGNGKMVSDTGRDILKLVVVNRYKNAPVAKAWIKNFGIRNGAIASTVAHDSHNIIAVGADDHSLLEAIDMLNRSKGGIAAVSGSSSEKLFLALPVAGLMSDNDGYQIAHSYTLIDRFVKQNLGSGLSAPFMTLSFMALLVIPHLKLSDLGLFDGDRFSFLD
jgi:adenine deaminase